MLTGFNTDVKYNGKVYHVQTEDKGTANPVIETLIYLGGEIIEARRTSYRDLLEKEGFRPQMVQKLMEKQHRTAIADIRNGRFEHLHAALEKRETHPGVDQASTLMHTDPGRSLDEIILEYLKAQAQKDALQIVIPKDIVFQEGMNIDFSIRVQREQSGQPVAGATIEIYIISTVRPKTRIWKGTTDKSGIAHVKRLQLPVFIDGMGAMVIQAFYEDLSAEDRHLLLKPPKKGKRTNTSSTRE